MSGNKEMKRFSLHFLLTHSSSTANPITHALLTPSFHYY